MAGTIVLPRKQNPIMKMMPYLLEMRQQQQQRQAKDAALIEQRAYDAKLLKEKREYQSENYTGTPGQFRVKDGKIVTGLPKKDPKVKDKFSEPYFDKKTQSFFQKNLSTNKISRVGAVPKGIKLTVGDDGQVTFQTGVGGTADLTPATKSSLQKEIVGLTGQLGDLEFLGKTAFTDALTIQGKAKKAGLRLADSLKIDIGPENREYLGKTRVFVEGVEQVFNQYRKLITGAQAAMKEITMLRDSILNKKLSPSEFQYSFDRYMGQIKRSLRIKRMLLREGVTSEKALGKQIDRMFKSNADVPDTEIDARGDELKAGGMSDQAVIQQLRKEGYPLG